MDNKLSSVILILSQKRKYITPATKCWRINSQMIHICPICEIPIESGQLITLTYNSVIEKCSGRQIEIAELQNEEIFHSECFVSFFSLVKDVGSAHFKQKEYIVPVDTSISEELCEEVYSCLKQLDNKVSKKDVQEIIMKYPNISRPELLIQKYLDK